MSSLPLTKGACHLLSFPHKTQPQLQELGAITEGCQGRPGVVQSKHSSAVKMDEGHQGSPLQAENSEVSYILGSHEQRWKRREDPLPPAWANQGNQTPAFIYGANFHSCLLPFPPADKSRDNQLGSGHGTLQEPCAGDIALSRGIPEPGSGFGQRAHSTATSQCPAQHRALLPAGLQRGCVQPFHHVWEALLERDTKAVMCFPTRALGHHPSP